MVTEIGTYQTNQFYRGRFQAAVSIAEPEIAIPASYLEKKGIEPVLGQTESFDLGQNVPSTFTVCGRLVSHRDR